MKTTFSFALAAMLVLSLSCFAQKNNELNGQTYNIKLTEISGKKPSWQWTTDQLSFKSGMIRSKMMHEHEKFDDTYYKIDIDSSSAGRKMKFVAEKKNPGGSDVEWKGTAAGNQIEGTVIWTNANGKSTYTFTGTLLK